MITRKQIQLLEIMCELDESMVMYDNGGHLVNITGIKIISNPSFLQVVDTCSEYFGVPIGKMKDLKRKKENKFARYWAMYFLKRTQKKEPLKNIAAYFGRGDHATCLHAIGFIIEHLYFKDNEFLTDHKKICEYLAIDAEDDLQTALEAYKPKNRKSKYQKIKSSETQERKPIKKYIPKSLIVIPKHITEDKVVSITRDNKPYSNNFSSYLKEFIR